MKIQTFFSILILVVTMSGSFSAYSETDPEVEAALKERAAKRLYPGGRDEEDLEVLNQVPEPALKINKQAVQNDIMKSMSGQSTESQNNN